MRGKALISLLALAVLAGALSSTAAAQTAAPTVVATDDAGDWGIQNNIPPTAIPVGGNELGQDLLEASIAMADDKTVNFIIKVGSLPDSGGWPEITRYGWAFTVDGAPLELDGKFTNYSRGSCDPTAGSCPPPRDPGEAPFVVRGTCDSSLVVFTSCEELELVHATFDAAAGTITIPVTLEAIKAAPGSIIGPGENSTFTAGIYAVPSAWVSANAGPFDEMFQTASFTIPGAEEPAEKPKKKKKKKKGGSAPAGPTGPAAPTSLKPFVF